VTIEEFTRAVGTKINAASVEYRHSKARKEYTCEWVIAEPRYLAGINIHEDMLANVHDVFIDATAEEILKNYQRYTNPQYPDDLPAGASHFDGRNKVYYRGDGVNDTVYLPDGKAAQGVIPRRRYRSNLKNRTIVTFAEAVPMGLLVTITLRDTE